MSAPRSTRLSAKDEAIAIALKCRGITAPAKSAGVRSAPVASKPSAPNVAVATTGKATVETTPGVAIPEAPNPLESMGYTKAEADTLSFLGRCGAIPTRSSAGPMPSAADFKASASPTIAGYTEEETATLAMLKRAGFGSSAKGAIATLPGEADGLTKEEAATLAFVTRAGFGPAAKPTGVSNQKGFHR